MSEDSPRWPGSQGGAGLDFSPYRKPKDATQAPASAPSASDDTREFKPVADQTAAAPERAASSASPASAASPSSTRITPGAAARAADTAKAWAATPVGSTPSAEGARAAAGAAAAGTATAAATGSQPTPARAAQPVDVTPAKPTVELGRKPKAASSRRTRKARLRLSRIDPWSVMKTTFLFSIAFGVMMLAITFVLWSVLSGSGALDSVNELVNRVIGDENTQFNIGTYLDIRRVMGFAMTIAFIDVLIITAVSTLFAFLYNLSAIVLGGLEVTLAED